MKNKYFHLQYEFHLIIEYSKYIFNGYFLRKKTCFTDIYSLILEL